MTPPCGAAGALQKIVPRANDRLGLRAVGLRHELREFVADHFVVDAIEHFFGRWIHRTDNALLVDRDHAVENIFDDRADTGLDALKLRELPANEDKAVAVGNDQQADGKHAKQGEPGCLYDSIPARHARP